MPTYTYQCEECGHAFDLFHGMNVRPRVRCEKCEGRCKRMIGTGAGFIFKGSGFYATDYKKTNGAASGAKPAAKDSGETKSATKTEGKTEQAGSTPTKPAGTD